MRLSAVDTRNYDFYLAVVDGAVSHGGTIRAESEGTNKGSTFIVELPV